MTKAKPADKGHLNKGFLFHGEKGAKKGLERQRRNAQVRKVEAEMKTPVLNWGKK